MNAQGIMDEIEKCGVVWLGGEMEFPAGLTCGEAWERAHQIACECGYSVERVGLSVLRIGGGDIPDYVELDWFDGHRLGPECVRLWTCERAYTKDALENTRATLQAKMG
jgi:hypothetical protein